MLKHECLWHSILGNVLGDDTGFKKESESEVSQSCPTLWDPMDTRLLHPWDFPGKNTGVGCHFLLQGSSQPRDRTQVSHIVDRRFTVWATREVSTKGPLKCLWKYSKNKTVKIPLKINNNKSLKIFQKQMEQDRKKLKIGHNA